VSNFDEGRSRPAADDCGESDNHREATERSLLPSGDEAGFVPTQPERPRRLLRSLHEEQRTHVDTWEAALMLNRQPQTLRIWACKENGPLRPRRLHGRLSWSVDEIRELLGFARRHASS
jgi:hypothetical protein